MSDLGSCFQPKNHPDVKSGKRMVPNVLSEFFQNLNTISTSGYVNLEQFVEFYGHIGAFEEDADFEALMRSLWKSSSQNTGGGAARGGGVTSLANAVSTMSVGAEDNATPLPLILQQLKTALKARGASGIIGMGRIFRIMDDDGSKSLNMAEFKKGIKENGLNFSEIQLNQLFALFDKDKSGSIDYEEFLQALRVRESSPYFV
jgi:hypothetical protein